MRILLRRWTTQFLGLEADLEEDEADPEVLEEVAHLEPERELGKTNQTERGWERKKVSNTVT